jgi:hypothetical protein
MSRSAPTLPIGSALDALRRLHSFDWSWTVDDLGAAMEAAGLVLHDPADDMSIPVTHPELPGVESFATTIVGEPTVVSVSLTLTRLIDEDDPEARAQLEQLAAAYREALVTELGEPTERPRQRGADWSWNDDVLELRDLGITVALTLLHSASRRKRDGG